MKRRWKIALWAVGVLTVAGTGGFLFLLLSPPKPAPVLDPGPTGQRIEADGILANYFPVKGASRGPAILLLGGSEGGIGKDVEEQALLLQRAGFSTLHLAYHNAPGKSPKLVNIPLEEFYRGLDWLKRQPEVDAGRLAVMGYSKGAEAALLVATRYPGIRTLVLGMPSSVVWDGMSGENYMLGSFSSSWSEKGKPLPSLEYKGRTDPESLVPVFVNGLKLLPSRQETLIPVERFKGRILMVCGEKDTVWPGCMMADQISNRAKTKSGPETDLLRYADGGHGVMGAPFTDPVKLSRWARFSGGSAKGNADARRDSWPKIIAFLNAELK